jgi:hypothetical protein
MATCIRLFCDFLDSPDIRNLSEATKCAWMIDHVVRRRELLVAILNGRPEDLKLDAVELN